MDLINWYVKEIYNPKNGNYNKEHLEIYRDESPLDPRTNDNLSKMICFSDRYKIGDNHKYNREGYESFKELIDEIVENEHVIVYSGIALYDYGTNGLKVCLEPELNSAHVIGIIYISRERVIKLCGEAEKYRNAGYLFKVMDEEIKEYNQYLSGDVYGYILKHLEFCNCCKHYNEVDSDSCWGYFGNNWDENGLLSAAEWDKFNLHTKLV